jgi:predicted amidohydrolase YtcJ
MGRRAAATRWIDSITPNNPVWVNRLDGHMSLANSAALEAANVTRATRDVAAAPLYARRAASPRVC